VTDRRPKRGQNRTAGKARAWNPSELWRRAPELPAPELIEPANDPTALLRSLGDPPLPGNAMVASRYAAAVAERAAAMATAIAASANVLADPDARD
jgi:hypothetical protein